jgi:hypothetical protein
MPAVASFLLVAVLPGLACAVVLRGLRGSPHPSGPAFLAVVAGAGLTCWTLVAGILGRTVGLTAASTWTATGVVGAVSLVLLALPSSRRVLGARPFPRREVAWGWSVLGLGALAWLPMGLLVWQTTWGPLGGTSWYYSALAQQTAAAGHLPATSVEFGTTVPFLSDYPLFTLGTAFLNVQVPADQVHVVRQLLTTVPVLYLAVGTAALARALGASRLASLAAVPIAIGSGLAILKLTAYRPEGFALGVAVLAVALVALGLRARDPGVLAGGGAVTAVLSQVHGIAVVTAAAYLVAVSVALWAKERSWAFVRVVALAAGLVVAATLVTLMVTGSVAGQMHHGGISDLAGRGDPTWEFLRAARDKPPSEPPTRLELVQAKLHGSVRGDALWYLVVALVCYALLLVTRATRKRLGPLAVFMPVALVCLTIPVAVLLFGWDSYVPRRTGTLRMLSEASLIRPVLLAGGATAAALLLRSRFRRSWVVPAFQGAVLVLALAVGVTATAHQAAGRKANRTHPEDLQALSDLDIPPDSTVLTDGYSEGIIHAVTGAHGLLEGRAPYTFPHVLYRANLLLREAREFYAHPRANRAFLDENGVDYVIVQREPKVLASAYRFDTRNADRRLSKGSAFEQVLDTPRLAVFRYLGADGAEGAEGATGAVGASGPNGAAGALAGSEG